MSLSSFYMFVITCVKAFNYEYIYNNLFIFYVYCFLVKPIHFSD